MSCPDCTYYSVENKCCAIGLKPKYLVCDHFDEFIEQIEFDFGEES